MTLSIGLNPLYSELRATHPSEWRTLVKDPTDIEKLLFGFFNTQTELPSKDDPFIRKVVIWSTSDRLIEPEVRSLLMGRIYKGYIIKIFDDWQSFDVRRFDELDQHRKNKAVEAAILAGRDELVTKRLIPMFYTATSLQKCFFQAAWIRGNTAMYNYLLRCLRKVPAKL